MTTLHGDNLAAVRDAFSNHDFEDLDTLWLLPLTTRGAHVGMVLIAESEADRLEAHTRGVLFSSVARLVATRITQRHVAGAEDLPGRAVVLSHDGFVEEAERMAQGGRESLILAEVDVDGVVSQIAQAHEAMDRYRLAGEIARFVALMLSGHAHVGTTKDGRTLALMEADRNVKLLLHQAGQGLRKLFPEVTEGRSLLRRSVSWETATTDFHEVLRTVTSDT
ncbi:MAG: hypothetical protein ACOCYC_00605 [bacterium]